MFGSIDYLLDILSVVIIGLVASRTNENLEAKLGKFLETTRILGFLREVWEQVIFQVTPIFLARHHKVTDGG